MSDPRSLEERIVISPGETDFTEHSKNSRAKKTVEVAPFVAQDATAARTIDPIEKAGGTDFLGLEVGKAYRIVSDGSLRFRLSQGVSAAAATDIYLPADMPVVIAMRAYDRISYIRTGGTFTQAVEVS